ncbi:hypothetical protein [Streptomyces sp. NPDC007205]|uniref:hypothetical protein n=1 Tax=Streptomyces sp. NPDC007205 TaxID=3154316 RepID=UPI0033E5FC80
MPRKTSRTLYSRADLRKVHGISEPTLQNLWTDRENNGHPPVAETIDGVMHWDGDVWAAWHHELQRQRAAASTTNSPKLDGDPEEMAGPAEPAKICGFADSTTVSHYVKNSPEGWPEPDDWDEHPTRRRPNTPVRFCVLSCLFFGSGSDGLWLGGVCASGTSSGRGGVCPGGGGEAAGDCPAGA